MYIESFKQLIVWQRSMEVVKEIYSVTNEFPKSESLLSEVQRMLTTIIKKLENK